MTVHMTFMEHQDVYICMNNMKILVLKFTLKISLEIQESVTSTFIVGFMKAAAAILADFVSSALYIAHVFFFIIN